MRTFFHQLKRNAGFVVLAIAVALAGLWGRSYSFHESVIRFGPGAIHEVASEEGCLIWVCDRRSTDLPHNLTQSLWDWQSRDAFNMSRRLPIKVRDPLVFRDTIHWQWKWDDFNVGSGSKSSERRQFQISSAMSRNDPEDISKFAGRTQFLWDYFDRRTVCVVPCWMIVLVLTLISGGLILIPMLRRFLNAV